jgi:tRNA modification GTPase
MMRGGFEDTICAIATPVGEGGIGIVRLSGSQSLSIADGLIRLRSGRPFTEVSSHKLYLADIHCSWSLSIKNAKSLLDEALVVYMKAPRSFTGEDTVEIQSHGGPVVLSFVCQACVERGARLAEPGEFTKRAFLNGRLDLSQAEAVLDTIRAKSAASLNVAQRQLRGDLGREVEEARAALVGALAHVEAGIDFVDEDITFLEKDELANVIEGATKIVHKLQATAQAGRFFRDGARVVILGRPNVGKSSLLNRLLRQDRAIVTAIPGTTRDVIEEWIDLEGLPVRLMDTAGLRETKDVVEREGITRTRAAQTDADLQLIVIDGGAGLTEEDRLLLSQTEGRKHILVVNKIDLIDGEEISLSDSAVTMCRISAKTGEGLDRLKETIRTQLVAGGNESNEGVMVSNIRHRTALQCAEESLIQAQQSLDQGMVGELIAMDVRAAADALGEITGAISTDEILGKIFSEFCIGK